VATLKDIAKRCGVSTATVSYVVNNSGQKLLPETRERVLKAVAEMGYQPNAYARALKGHRTKVIGVVFPHVTVPLTNVYFGPALEGIITQATERRMATMLLTGFTWEETEQGAEREFSGICDGFLLIAPRKDSQFASDLAKSGVPLVSVGTQVTEPRVSSVDADNQSGGKMATNHLLELGHRRIAMVLTLENASPASAGGPEQHMWSAIERQHGYWDAIRALGLVPDPTLTATISSDPVASRLAIRRLLLQHKPTAVFGCNDGAAYRTVEVCRELGIRVPQDLSVIGFDDIANAATFDPPLTTIRQPISGIGSNAVEMLCAQIEGKTQGVEHRKLPVELIQRRSTAPIYVDRG
jgi:DNA-binding LacI/PurR family transcriptional regulator